MRRLALILSVMFIALTFIGAIYVIFNNGNKNAGYAVVPMVLALTSLSLYRREK